MSALGSIDLSRDSSTCTSSCGVLGATAVERDQVIHLVRTAERILGVEGCILSAAGVGE